MCGDPCEECFPGQACYCAPEGCLPGPPDCDGTDTTETESETESDDWTSDSNTTS
jgi:hypothetical protein